MLSLLYIQCVLSSVASQPFPLCFSVLVVPQAPTPSLSSLRLWFLVLTATSVLSLHYTQCVHSSVAFQPFHLRLSILLFTICQENDPEWGADGAVLVAEPPVGLPLPHRTPRLTLRSSTATDILLQEVAGAGVEGKS